MDAFLSEFISEYHSIHCVVQLGTLGSRVHLIKLYLHTNIWVVSLKSAMISAQWVFNQIDVWTIFKKGISMFMLVGK